MLHSSLRKKAPQKTPSVGSTRSLVCFIGQGAGTSEGEYLTEYNRVSKANSFFCLMFFLGGVSCFSIQYAMLPYSFPEYNDALLSNINSGALTFSECGTTYPIKIVDDVKDFDGKAETMNDHERATKVCPVILFTLGNMLLSDVGQAIGAIIGGILGDLYGRKLICLCMFCPWTLAVLLLLIPSTAITYQTIFFCLNVAGGALLCLLYVNLMEISHKKHRVYVMYLPYAVFIGLIVLSADLKHRYLRWNACQYFNIVTLNVLAFALWYIPESPRWLLNKGKKDQAFESLKDLTHVIGCRLISVPNEEQPSTSGEILIGMFVYLKRRKLSIFVVLCVLSVINGFLFSVPRWKGIYIEYEKWSDFKYVRMTAWLLSVPFTIPIYFSFGLKYGQLFLYLMYAVTSLVMIFISGSTIVALVYNSAATVFSMSGSVMLFWCVIETFPTFIRATMLTVCFTLFLMVQTTMMCTQQIWAFKMYRSQMHICVCLVSVLGLIVLLVPRQSIKKDLLNQKLVL